MPSIWENIKRRASRSYDYSRLVDIRAKEDPAGSANDIHIICDIDKTYLETQFETFYQIARIAFERATSKRSVRGASDVLIAARWSHCRPQNLTTPLLPRPLHFVSSSPPQLRSVLEEKLYLDGIDWTSDTFKNQAYNLIKGRVDLLKQHVAYKSAAVLRLIGGAQSNARFVLIGDNAEWDAYVYLGVQLLAAKRLSVDTYRQYLEIAGVDAATAAHIANSFTHNNAAEVIGILIRNAPNYQFIKHPPLTDCVQGFEHYFQAATALVAWNVVEPSVLWQLARAFHNRHGVPRDELIACLDSLRLTNDSAVIAAAQHIIERLSKIAPVGGSKQTFAIITQPRAPELDAESILAGARAWVEKLRHSRTMTNEADA